MNKLYTFTLNKKEKVEEAVSQVNEKGETIKVLQTIEKNVSQSFFLQKPGRTLTEKAEIFYNKIFWECQREGILPLTQLQKRFLDDGGILTKEEQTWRADTYEKIWNQQVTYKELLDKNLKTPEEEEKLKKTFEAIVQLWTDIQSFEEDKGGTLYQNTAESVAKNRQTLWWAVHLAYQEIDGKTKPVFGDGSYDDKLKIYDTYNEGNDEYLSNLAQRFFFVTSLWNFGRAQTQSDFEVGVKAAENKGLIDAAFLMKEVDKDEKASQATNDAAKLEDKTEQTVVTSP